MGSAAAAAVCGAKSACGHVHIPRVCDSLRQGALVFTWEGFNPHEINLRANQEGVDVPVSSAALALGHAAMPAGSRRNALSGAAHVQIIAGRQGNLSQCADRQFEGARQLKMKDVGTDWRHLSSLTVGLPSHACLHLIPDAQCMGIQDHWIGIETDIRISK